MHAMLLTRFVLPLAGEASTAPAPVTSSGEFGMDVQPAPDTQGAPDETTDNGQGAEASDEAAEGKLRRGEEFWGIYSSEEAQRAIWAAKRCEALRSAADVAGGRRRRPAAEGQGVARGRVYGRARRSERDVLGVRLLHLLRDWRLHARACVCVWSDARSLAVDSAQTRRTFLQVFCARRTVSMDHACQFASVQVRSIWVAAIALAWCGESSQCDSGTGHCV